MESDPEASTYSFGPFFLDTHTRVLRRRGGTEGMTVIPLGARAIDVLLLLLRRNGALVSKQELMDAVWPGVAVEENNLAVQISALRRALDTGRDASSVIQTISGRGYRFAAEIKKIARASPDAATSQGEAGTLPASTARPARPSIAVMPFTNLSSDPEQDYFADGLVEDLITAISRMHWLFVIARNSSFTFKGRAVDVKQVGRELGVLYVLEGSVRKGRVRVRITAQLINAETGIHLWADRFEGPLDDLFDLQDQITAKVVGAIAPRLEKAEVERVRRKPTDNYDAYDYYLRGLASAQQWTREAVSEALRLFYQAIELDPDFATPYGMAAWCYNQRKANGWTVDRAWEVAETARLARRAVALGGDDPLALTAAGFGLAHGVGELDHGAACIDRALELNPNLALAYHFSGWTRIYLGEPELAIEHLAHGMRLSPLDPQMGGMHAATAFAHFFAGRHELASLWAERSVRERPNYPNGIYILAAASAMAGRLSQAEGAVASLRKLNPAYRISDFTSRTPFRRAADIAKFAEALRMAGLAE